MPRTAFFSFPATAPYVEEAISQAATLTDRDRELILIPWPKLEVTGLKIDDLIRDRIAASDFLVADITYPNFNVYYEVGYAIGKQKPVIATVNFAVARGIENANLIGIFDTIHQTRYQNAVELADALSSSNANAWTNHYVRDKDHTQPLFLLDTLRKIDFRNSIVQTIANSSVKYRVFDPGETARLSLPTAISGISSSAGIILPLLSEEIDDSFKHNLRAAFLAGLAHGFGMEPLIIQFEDKPAPLDYRDFIETARLRREIEQAVDECCKTTLIRNQQRNEIIARAQRTILDDIDIGASSAENEYEKLARYFIRTAAFFRALRGSGSIVVGRKGSGKSAIFFQMVEEISKDRRNLTVDLRPASHNLSELRQELLSVVNVGVFDHTIAAFWQYILYAEILLKLREEAMPTAKYSLDLLKQIGALEKRFHLTNELVAGDFTSRLEIAVRSILKNIKDIKPGRDAKEQLTNILFERDIPDLRDAIVSLGHKYQTIFLALDDLDKGWPARQVEEHDIRTILHLISVLHRMQRDLGRRSIRLKYALFLRSDVYENLVEETADRGKYDVVGVDWSDPAQLDHLMRERVITSVDDSRQVEAWQSVNPRVGADFTALDLIISSALMRPRFVIDLCEKTISFAINRGHAAVQANDVADALAQHSLHLVSDFGYEIRDVSGVSEDIFYKFIGEGDTLTPDEVLEIVKRAKSAIAPEKIVDLLVWYGFLGIPGSDGKPVFIFDRAYDIRRLMAERERLGSNLLYVVNPAFLKGLSH